MGLSDTSTCFGSSSNIWTKDLFLSYCHWQYYFSAKFCIGAPLQHLIPVQMITSCHFFLLLFPHNPPQKRPFTARSDHRKGLPGPMLMTFSPSQSASSANLLYRHQPCFLSGLQGSQKRHLLLLPSPCHTPDPPQSWLNAGSFPDALRCQDFEGGTRSQKTLVLETYSYSPERKDSLSKPHPFTATQFPFFVSWLKPMPFFFLLLSSMVSGSLLLSLFYTPLPSCFRPSFAWDLWHFYLQSPLKEPFSTLLEPLRL